LAQRYCSHGNDPSTLNRGLDSPFYPLFSSLPSVQISSLSSVGPVPRCAAKIDVAGDASVQRCCSHGNDPSTLNRGPGFPVLPLFLRYLLFKFLRFLLSDRFPVCRQVVVAGDALAQRYCSHGNDPSTLNRGLDSPFYPLFSLLPSVQISSLSSVGPVPRCAAKIDVAGDALAQRCCSHGNDPSTLNRGP
jgi:hypothetical protein